MADLFFVCPLSIKKEDYRGRSNSEFTKVNAVARPNLDSSATIVPSSANPQKEDVLLSAVTPLSTDETRFNPLPTKITPVKY